jgi:hypothetical protein
VVLGQPGQWAPSHQQGQWCPLRLADPSPPQRHLRLLAQLDQRGLGGLAFHWFQQGQGLRLGHLHLQHLPDQSHLTTLRHPFALPVPQDLAAPPNRVVR